MPAELAAGGVVGRAVEDVGGGGGGALGEVDFGDLEVVGGLAGGVRTEEDAVDGVGLVGGSVGVSG